MILACLLFSLTFATPLQGRKHPKAKSYAVIFGTVWGPDDRPVPGVRVKIRNANNRKLHWEVISSRRGEFEQLVPGGPGTYVLTAVTSGLKAHNGKELQPGPEVTVEVADKERAVTGLHLK